MSNEYQDWKNENKQEYMNDIEYCYSKAILECQRAVIRWGQDKEPNPTLYNLIHKFVSLGGSLESAHQIARMESRQEDDSIS